MTGDTNYGAAGGPCKKKYLFGRIRYSFGRIRNSFGRIRNLFGQIRNSFGRISYLFGRIRYSFRQIRNSFGRIRNLFGRIRNLFGRISYLFGQIRDFVRTNQIFVWANFDVCLCLNGFDAFIEPLYAKCAVLLLNIYNGCSGMLE